MHNAWKIYCVLSLNYLCKWIKIMNSCTTKLTRRFFFYYQFYYEIWWNYAQAFYSKQLTNKPRIYFSAFALFASDVNIFSKVKKWKPPYRSHCFVIWSERSDWLHFLTCESRVSLLLMLLLLLLLLLLFVVVSWTDDWPEITATWKMFRLWYSWF